jgi:MFS family permease
MAVSIRAAPARGPIFCTREKVIMYYNKCRLGLSHELWLVQVGILINMLGYGAVLPFELIYLHDGRGLSLGVAGLVVATLTGMAVVTAPLAGGLVDRFGARGVAAAGGSALAAGYAGLAFAGSAAPAFAAAALAGAGNGALNTAQTTLIATLAPRELRHRATAVSRVAANAGLGLGGAIGGLVAARGLGGYVALFLVNAASYLVYVVVLLAVVREPARPEPLPGGYRVVLRDRAFVHLALTNVAIIAVGWGVLPWLIPAYARHELRLGAGLIGLLLLANALVVVVAQVPIARLAEGRRRVVMSAAAALIFAGACLLALLAARVGALAGPALLAAAVAIGVGECFHSAVVNPLVADLAPTALRGRYMAAIGLSFWVGLALAPALGAPLLAVSAPAALLAAAGVAVVAAASSLALERRLPDAARRTPRPHASGRPAGDLREAAAAEQP